MDPLVALLALVGAVVAAAAGAQPTGLRAADLVWSALLGATVVVAAAGAGDASRTWFAGVVALAAVPSWWTVAALAGLVTASSLTVVGQSDRTRRRGGALTGLLVSAAALRLPPVGRFGSTALIVLVALAPLFVSARRRSSRARRRRWTAAVAVTVGLCVVGTAAAAVALLGAALSLSDGATTARGAVRTATSDPSEATVEALGVARDDFRDAYDELSAAWALPGRAVPVVGHYLSLAKTAASAGTELTSVAIDAAARTGSSARLVVDGAVDVAALQSYRPTAEEGARTLAAARDDLAAADSGWLIAPARRQLAKVGAELRRATPAAVTSAEVLGLMDSLLGVERPRNYLVLVTNPAESRELGGFAGGYVVLRVEQGRVTTLRSGKSSDLSNDRTGPAPEVGDQSYRDRYGRYRVGEYLMNATAAPDLPTNAVAARAAFAAATGIDVDGIVVVDPAGIAALLELTGPVDVPAAQRKLGRYSVEKYLLADQYRQFASDSSGRKDVLVDVARAVTDAIWSRPLPGPAKVVSTLAPAVRDGHLMFFSLHPEEQSTLSSTGVSGQFGALPGHDFLSVRGSNANANKIDVYLRRSVDYAAQFDPATGRVSATATVTVRNEAPTSGQPQIVIGNGSTPPGTNSMTLALHSALALEDMEVDGELTTPEVHEEFGGYSYRVPLTVPAGSSVTLRYRLAGVVRAGRTYRLDVSSQPVVFPDQYQVSVTGAGAAAVVGATGLEVSGDEASGTVPSQWRAPVAVRFGKP